MKPVERINTQIQDLLRLKTLAAESGQVTREGIQAKVDSNADGKLSEDELTQAGFRDLLQTAYQKGSAQPSVALFEASGIDARIEKLQTQRNALVDKQEEALKGKVESFTRLLFNHFDENQDGALDIREINQIDRKELRRIAKEFGVEPEESQGILTRLHTLAAARTAQRNEARQQKPNQAPAGDEIILPASTEKDFASGMRYEGDPVDDAIEAAGKGDQRAAFKAAFLAKAGNTPANQAFLAKLGSQGMLSQQNLFYLSSIAKDQSPDKVAQIAARIEGYLATPATGQAIRANERKAFLNAMLRDVAFPEDINQGEKGTCGATAIQIELARRNPVKYTEMTLSLAQNKPYALLPTAKGEARTLHPNTTFRGDSEDDRSLSAKLVQNALMDLGHQAGENDMHVKGKNGKLVYFDSRMSIDTAQGLDESKVLSQAAKKYPELKGVDAKVLARLGDGVSEGEMEYVGQGFFGNHWNDVSKLTSSKDEMMQSLDISLALGRKVTIGSEDHAMTVIGKIQEKGHTLYQIASWSGHYTMTPAALRQRLTDVFVDLNPLAE